MSLNVKISTDPDADLNDWAKEIVDRINSGSITDHPTYHFTRAYCQSRIGTLLRKKFGQGTFSTQLLNDNKIRIIVVPYPYLYFYQSLIKAGWYFEPNIEDNGFKAFYRGKEGQDRKWRGDIKRLAKWISPYVRRRHP